MSKPGTSKSWPEHLAAAQAMGLSAADALETFEGWPARVREGRERREQMATWMDDREKQSDSGKEQI